MYFKQIDEIITGTKTQTRRIVKPGEYDVVAPLDSDKVLIDHDGHAVIYYPANQTRDITAVYTAAGRLKWRVGSDYAVSPGRGKPGVWWNPANSEWGVSLNTTGTDLWQYEQERNIQLGWQPLRIVITAIRRERLQAITEEDAIAEGVKSISPTYEGFLDGKHLYPWADGKPAYYDYLSGNWHKLKDGFCCCYEGRKNRREPAVCSYISLWEDINGAGSWNKNHEVWVLEFRVQQVSSVTTEQD